MKSNFVLLLFLVFSAQGFAWTTATWKGQVHFSSNTGYDSHHPFEFSMVYSDQSFSFFEKLFAMELILQVDEKDLFLDHQPVGSLEKDSFRVKVIDKKNGCEESWSFNSQGIYLNTFYCDNGYSSSVQGLLTMDRME